MRHVLVVVLVIAACAVLAGCRSLAAIGEWAADLPQYVLEALGARHRPASGLRVAPSESTIRRTLQSIDGHAFDQAVCGWLAEQAEENTPAAGTRAAVAVDGKTARGARTTDDGQIHLMAAFDHDSGIVLGQVDVDGKTNEITRFQPLLDPLDLAGKVVTADALHTQRAHARYLVEDKDAHYVLTVKQNQPTLFAQLSALPWAGVPGRARERNRAHGRSEHRAVLAVTVPAGLHFPYAAQAFRIRRTTRHLDGQPKHTETVYGITSLHAHQAGPAHLGTYTRGHWSIENRLHWVRDVTFDEDRSQVRTGNGPERWQASATSLSAPAAWPEQGQFKVAGCRYLCWSATCAPTASTGLHDLLPGSAAPRRSGGQHDHHNRRAGRRKSATSPPDFELALLAGATNIARTLRANARDCTRPLTMLGLI
ncbi:ISAs1 family transposase [Streptomyces olivoreticuli]